MALYQHDNSSFDLGGLLEDGAGRVSIASHFIAHACYVQRCTAHMHLLVATTSSQYYRDLRNVKQNKHCTITAMKNCPFGLECPLRRHYESNLTRKQANCRSASPYVTRCWQFECVLHRNTLMVQKGHFHW